MPRILLLMTTRTYRAASFMAAAERLGCDVVVGSEKAQALAMANPAGHVTLDFSHPARAAEGIVNFATSHPVDAILPADDEGVVPAALASATLGLAFSPVEAVRAARDKHAMRVALTAARIPSPRFARVPLAGNLEEIGAALFYPCVVKPLSLSASRGVIRADDPAAFVAAARRIEAIHRAETAEGAPMPEFLLVEEYIPGSEVAVEGLLTEGHLRVLAVYDKPDPLEGPFFEETIYVTPSRLAARALEAAEACVRDVARVLGLAHGPVHAEVRLNDAGAWIVEIAPRSIGGHCSRTLRFEGGLELEDVILRHALGVEGAEARREPGAAGVMMIPIPEPGILEALEGREEAGRVAGVEEVELSVPLGQAVVPPPEGSRYLGFIFARLPDPAEVESALREAHRRLRLRIRPLHSASGGFTLEAPASKRRSE